MSNVESLLNGQGETLDLQVGRDGESYLKAAGDSLGIPANNSDPIAPALVQIVGAAGSQFASTPTGVVGVEGTGTLGAGTYYYRVSATTGSGETLASPEIAVTITATKGVVLSWNASPGATGYRVYGRSTGAELFIAATAGGVTTYTDSGSITPSGALPASNTARISQAVESTPATSSTGTLSNVSASASSVTLLAANTARKGVTIVNDSSAVLYVKCAASAASTTSYTVVLAGASSAPFSYWECPFSYTGEIRGIWASATGSARLTEFS